MATLANIFNHFNGVTAAVGSDRVAVKEINHDYKLRALPNEDVYFFSKRIDNSRVVKQSDPRSQAQDWKLVGGAGFAACALIAMLLPSGYGLIAGYQLNTLQQQRQSLVAERARLEVEEAKLISPARLEEIAKEQEFIDPAPGRTIYLQPKDDSSVALNRQ